MKGRKSIGTNYYWFKNEREYGVLPEGGIHIGKCSAGWVFHFQAHQNLETVEKFKELTKEGYIYDEYGDLISSEEFWEIVENTKKPWMGQKPLCNYTSAVHGAEDWVEEGYMFTLCDFC